VHEEALPPSEKLGEKRRPRRSFVSAPKRWVREPLLHFLLLGVALFAVYSYINRGRGGVESSKQIALTLDDLRQMEMYFESQWHRPPTPQEFQAMVDDKVREEVLYREGIGHEPRQGRYHRQAPHGTEDAIPGRGRGRRSRAHDGRTQGLVREERPKIRPSPAVPRSGICTSLPTAADRARMTTR